MIPEDSVLGLRFRIESVDVEIEEQQRFLIETVEKTAQSGRTDIADEVMSMENWQRPLRKLLALVGKRDELEKRLSQAEQHAKSMGF